jgi:hypothetical protein
MNELRRPSRPCKSHEVDRETREKASEVRAVAPLVVTGPTFELVGPCTLVTNGAQTTAFSSAELLRRAGEPLAIALTLDCKKTLPVTAWSMGRVPHMGVIELGAPFPRGEQLDVEPLPIGSLCATVDTRGAPSALVTVIAAEGGVARRVIPVHVDAIDGGGMSDDILARLASPDSEADVAIDIDGALLLSWMPADAVLGRPSEVLAVALASPYRQKTYKPRELPAIAELFGLDDIGRALPWDGTKLEGSNELGNVAGEIRTVTGPLDRIKLDE